MPTAPTGVVVRRITSGRERLARPQEWAPWAGSSVGYRAPDPVLRAGARAGDRRRKVGGSTPPPPTRPSIVDPSARTPRLETSGRRQARTGWKWQATAPLRRRRFTTWTGTATVAEGSAVRL